MPDSHLTSAQVARLLGVTPATVKRWADAGLLPCARTAGAHRRFDPEEIARFARSQGVARPDPAERWADRILEGPDPLELQATLLGERARSGAWWQVAELLGQAANVIGERWAKGQVSILEEHQASERLERALARIVEGLPARPEAPRVLLATAEGDEHTLGLALAEVVLRECGWATLWAGRLTPAAELRAAIESGQVDVLGLSASVVSRPAALVDELEALRPALEAHRVPLLAGGGGPWPEPLPFGRRIRDFHSLRTYLATEDALRASSREVRS